MGIEKDIVQSKFRSSYHKMLVNILYTNNWLSNLQLQLLKPYDITPAQYNVLRILKGQSPRPATINLIIERMLDKMSNASRIVDKLLSKSLVERVICPEDRRAVNVSITKKGLDLLEEINKEQRRHEDIFKKSLTESEAEQLSNLLDKVRLAQEE